MKVQLEESVYGLLCDSLETEEDLPERDTLVARFLDAVWENITVEDKWAFAKILFHPDSSLWNSLTIDQK